jgi:3'-phosphoadenosine 5'-phosphosulfate sulfotransferase (PAPS reductase)/FAD synthetase
MSQLDSSREIVERAISQYSPYAIVCMMSGGKDSMLAYQLAVALGVPVSHVLHGVTGTGIAETTQFVRNFAATQKPTYIEANAGTSYVDYVQRKGFFGRGVSAHTFAYHVLKLEHFRKALSRHIRQGKRGRRILLINGARIQESANRAKNLAEPIRADENNVWVNIAHNWSKDERDAYLDNVGAPCNPVAKKLCRSAECLCGTQQSKATREEVSFFYPAWGKWLDELEAPVKAKFKWGWGENPPDWLQQEDAGQMRLFQPLCVECNDFEVTL